MTMYKIILTGKRNFEINSRKLLEAISSDNILKLKDNTKLSYEFQKAIEIGLEAM